MLAILAILESEPNETTAAQRIAASFHVNLKEAWRLIAQARTKRAKAPRDHA